LENELNIPGGKKPSHALKIHNCHILLVGDEGFGIPSKLFRFFEGKNLNEKKKVFSYRLTIARRNIECALGIWQTSSKYFKDFERLS
jgi:hypothetical protein